MTFEMTSFRSSRLWKLMHRLSQVLQFSGPFYLLLRRILRNNPPEFSPPCMTLSENATSGSVIGRSQAKARLLLSVLLPSADAGRSRQLNRMRSRGNSRRFGPLFDQYVSLGMYSSPVHHLAGRLCCTQTVAPSSLCRLDALNVIKLVGVFNGIEIKPPSPRP